MSNDEPVIRNCALGYACNCKWDDLKVIDEDEDDIRFCNTCQREVHDCHTKDDLIKSILLNRSVNVRESMLEYEDEPGIAHSPYRLPGMPAMPYSKDGYSQSTNPLATGHAGYGQSNPKPNPQPAGGFDDFDDDIPF